MASTRADPERAQFLNRLASTLGRLPRPRAYYIGFSGGLDSTVLLHAMSALRTRLDVDLHAIHVNHGLNPRAADWEEHCRQQCRRWSVPLTLRCVEVQPAKGESLEAVARQMRYQAFSEVIGDRDCLLTAHHQDDQAETVLLQLLRGSGPEGLAAMPLAGHFAAGWHVRPLIDCQRADLQRYAAGQRLEWIEDASNFDTRLRRNFVRHEIMPSLQRQWPAASRTLARAAHHCATAAELLEEIGEQDLHDVAGSLAGTIDAERLAALGSARQANVLRQWIRRCGLPLPRSVDIGRIRSEVIAARPDAAPLVAWPGGEVRRYRHLLYAMRPLPSLHPAGPISWDLTTPVRIPVGSLVAVPVEGRGVSRTTVAGRRASIRFRHGGERCHPAGRGHRHLLKKLLQESAIPPWLRDRMPLVYFGDELAVVPGVCVCEHYQAAAGEAGWNIEWRTNGASRDE